MEPKVKDVPRSSIRLWPLALLVLVCSISLYGFYKLKHSSTGNIVSGFVSDPSENLTNTGGRTNIVFLGMGGEGHEAPELTDSIILISLKHSDHSVALISIPRDVWVDSLKDKVNKAYKYGNEKREFGGRDLSKSSVSEVTGVPIHYALALDFNGFIKAIDAVGGIDLVVDRTFDDYKYPIPGKENAEPESSRYEHLHFEAGPTHLDGTMALKFARSRHALGEEGTDFARSSRQQKIILAFKDKLLQSSTLLDRESLDQVFTSFSSSVDTDITENDYGALIRFFVNFQKTGQSIKSLSLEKYFINPKNTKPYQGQWVLIPSSSWQEIHDYVAESLQ